MPLLKVNGVSRRAHRAPIGAIDQRNIYTKKRRAQHSRDRKSSRVDNFTTRQVHTQVTCVCVYYLLVKKEDARRRRRRRRAISIDSIQRWSPRVASCAASSSPAAATAQTHKSRRIKKGTHSTFPAQSRLLNSTQLNSNLNLI